MGEGLTELSNRISPKKHFDGRTSTTSDIWITPIEIISALGEFDLDPAAATHRPWNMARHHYAAEDDGLSRLWVGRVWLNPPYGKELPIWLERLVQHGNGIALVPARSTETQWFHKLIWEKANGILFKKGRINFFRENGEMGKQAPFPSCLVAYGMKNAATLKNVAAGEILAGHYVELKNNALELPAQSQEKLSA